MTVNIGMALVILLIGELWIHQPPVRGHIVKFCQDMPMLVTAFLVCKAEMGRNNGFKHSGSTVTPTPNPTITPTTTQILQILIITGF